MVFLDQLASPAGPGALEEHGDVLAALLEVIGCGERVEYAADRFFRARIRKDDDGYLLHGWFSCECWYLTERTVK